MRGLLQKLAGFVPRGLWPQKLLTQMALLVLLALLLAQGISVWVMSNAHRNVLMDTNERFALRQFASLVLLLEQTPPSLHPNILKTWRRPGRRVGFADQSPIAGDDSGPARRMTRLLERWLGSSFRGRVRVAVELQRRPPPGGPGVTPERAERPNSPSAVHSHPHRNPRWWRHRGLVLKRMLLAVQVSDDRWFYCRIEAPQVASLAARQTLISVAIASVLVLLVLFWQLRKITRPLRSLEVAANALGRGQQVEPVEECGPLDVRQTIAAFNQMNDRVQRFVSDRTRMLAALSHDLRTPITSMRLRLEMMAPSEVRTKLLTSLDEMQQMSEASLAFVRHSGDVEATQKVDLAALLDSLCEDLQELGMAVEYVQDDDAGAEWVLELRPVSLKRALRNVIENAIYYGGEAKVSLRRQAADVMVEVQDPGPGIPEDKLEAVFEPFVRVEESRSRETGGMGLGLSIARQIVTSHGGDIELVNTHPGLRVVIQLPD